MNYQQMQNNYLQNQVMSASPNKLIEMLLQAAIKYVKLAQIALNGQQLPQAHKQLTKAQDIVLELRYSLDTAQGGEIATELDQLYSFIYNELVQANIKKDPAPTEDVASLLAELLESWQTITQ